jgi:hypothetical protein
MATLTIHVGTQRRAGKAKFHPWTETLGVDLANSHTGSMRLHKNSDGLLKMVKEDGSSNDQPQEGWCGRGCGHHVWLIALRKEHGTRGCWPQAMDPDEC